MKHESDKRRRQRLLHLQQKETKIEEQYEQWMAQLNHVSENVMQKKTRLLEKLCELETRQRIDALLRESRRQKRKGVTYEQVKHLSYQEQRRHLDRVAEEARRHLQGQFVATLEEFSSVNAEQERRDIRDNLERYVQPVLERRRKLAQKQRAQSEQLMNDTVLKIVNQEKQRIKETSDTRLVEMHQRKCVALEEVSKHMHLSNKELDDLLQLEVIHYETDIGIADAEMEALRKRIDALQHETDETVDAFQEAIQKEKDIQDNVTRSMEEKRPAYEALKQRIEELKEEEIQLSQRAKRDTENMYKKSIATCIKASENTQKHIARLTEQTNDVVEKQRALHQEQQEAVSQLNAIKLSYEAVLSEEEQTQEEIQFIEDNSRQLQEKLERYQYKANHSSEVLKERRKELIEEKNKGVASQVMNRQLEQTLDLTCELIRTENTQMIPRASLYGLRSYLRELNAQYKESTQLLLDYLCYLKVIDAGISAEDKTTVLLQDAEDGLITPSQDTTTLVTVSLYEAEDHHMEVSSQEDSQPPLPPLSLILRRNLTSEETEMRAEFSRYITSTCINAQRVGFERYTKAETLFNVEAGMIFKDDGDLTLRFRSMQELLLREYFKQQRYARYLNKHSRKVTFESETEIVISSPLVDFVRSLDKKYLQEPSPEQSDITHALSVLEGAEEKNRAMFISKVKSILDQIQNFAAGDMGIEQQRIRQKLKRLKEEEKRQAALEKRKREIAAKNEALENLTPSEKSRKLNRLPESVAKQSSSTSMLIDQQRSKLETEKKFSPRSLLLLRKRRSVV